MFIWIVVFAAEALAVAAIWRLDMLPMEIFGALVLLFVLIWLLIGVLLLWGSRRANGKPGYFRRVIACLLAVVMTGGCYVVSSAVFQVNQVIGNITNPTSTTSQIVVYVLADDPAQTLQDASGYTFAISESYDQERTQQAIEQIEKELDGQIATESFASAGEMVSALYNQSVGAVIMDQAYVAILEDNEAYADFSQVTRILHKVTITQEQKWPIFIWGGSDDQNASGSGKPAGKNITETPFILYISGSDTRDHTLTTSRSDVNILAVVNPVTKQVLLVNTPRDYFVANPAMDGKMDKLTHCGIYGIDCSMGALAGLYQVPVNYYMQINFTGFETLIDAIGGINVYSEVAFSNAGCSVQEGYNQLNGSEALAFARERYSLAGGDNARGKNQMRVITAVIQKLSSGSTILANYSSILDSLEGMFITNVSSQEISALVKMQISDMASWNVVSYAVTGEGGSHTTASTPYDELYVMYQDEELVNYGSELINRVLNGEILTEADMTLPE